jgi:hypothetical protein
MGNPDPLCFEGEALGSSKDLARLASSESLSHIYMYHMYRLIIAALYGSRVQFLVFINVFVLITLRLLGTHG